MNQGSRSILFHLKLPVLLMLAAGILACQRQPGPAGRGKQSGFNRHAHGFEIIPQEGYTLLYVYDPWQGAEDVVFEYFLVPDGKPVPAELEGKKIIRTPVKRVVCFSTTQLAMIDRLGEGEHLVGASGIHFIFSPGLRSRADSGLIKEIGYEQGLSYETLLSLRPDLVLAYGVTGAVNQEITRMEEFGMPVVLTAEYLETHPLGKAEWMKFIAAFFEAGPMADSLFRSAAGSYMKLTSLAEKAGNNPLVMLGLPWKDKWYVSGGKSYAAELINDAGGEYVFANLDNRTSIPMELESVYHHCLEADIWVNPGAAMSREEILLTDSRLEDLKPFREGKIYSNQARMGPGRGNDYWESGTVQPHLILADLIRIFHPGLLEDEPLHFYFSLE